MDIDVSIQHLLREKGSVIWSISPQATVLDAIHKMAEYDVGALLVMEDSQLHGIVTERDYARKIILKGKLSRETLVRDIMTTPVLEISPHQTMQQAMRLMTEKRVRHLPVVENTAVIGVISMGDLAKWVISAQTTAIEQLEGYIMGNYPG